MQSLTNKTIPIDLDHLEESRRKTMTSFEGLTEQDLHYVPFNPYGIEGLRMIKKVKDLYRKHTPQQFRDNLNDLSHIEVVKLNIFPSDFKKIDLLTDEERAQKNKKETRVKKWTPRQWTPALAEEKVAYVPPAQRTAEEDFLAQFDFG
jgi:hypothetical protein